MIENHSQARQAPGGSKSLALCLPNRRPSNTFAMLNFNSEAHGKEFIRYTPGENFSPRGAGLLVACLGGAGE